jgi:hypothetical protein
MRRLLLFLALIAGCSVPPKVQNVDLLEINYVWLKITNLNYKSGGIIAEIEGTVISRENDILNVKSIKEGSVLIIQKHPDGKWCLPNNIFYTEGELDANTVYKVMYEFSDNPPDGDIIITPSGI